MALIKCPECGKENVSDSAAACPSCGYGIKEHFDKIRIEEEREKEAARKKKLEEERTKQQAEEAKRREEEEKVKKEEDEKREREELEKIPLPEKPYFSVGMIIYLFVLFVVLLCMGGDHLNEPEMIGLLIELFLMLGGIPTGVYLLVVYREKYNEYIFAINNPTEYRKQQQNVQKHNEYLQHERAKEYLANQNCKPKCPTCGSTNVRRISGGRYVCNQCRYKW